MGAARFKTIKRGLVRLGVEAMPMVPLPSEWYRKLLVNDSEKRYASGRWGYMKGSAELHRYSLISGCATYYMPGPRRILDVGCGEGILQARIPYDKYVGVDMNAAAIAQARAREDASTSFILADARAYEPRETYDVVIFNESLYYMSDPMSVVAHYRKYLADPGIIVVCMFQTNLARKLWKKFRRTDLVELTMAKVSNDAGFASVVRVYARPGFPQPAPR
jgi:SAM-dependent methyltransferase